MTSHPAPPELVASLEALEKQYGKDAFRSAAKQVGRKRRGNIPIDDLALARPWLDAEANRWIKGTNIQERGRLQRMASDVAKAHPGHSRVSTFDRVRRKLGHYRIPAVVILATAQMIHTVPMHVMLHRLRQAMWLAPRCRPHFLMIADLAAEVLLQHRALIGEPPRKATMAALAQAVQLAPGVGIGAGVVASLKIAAYRQALGEVEKRNQLRRIESSAAGCTQE